jgi:hypothetical protein
VSAPCLIDLARSGSPEQCVDGTIELISGSAALRSLAAIAMTGLASLLWYAMFGLREPVGCPIFHLVRLDAPGVKRGVHFHHAAHANRPPDQDHGDNQRRRHNVVDAESVPGKCHQDHERQEP